MASLRGLTRLGLALVAVIALVSGGRSHAASPDVQYQSLPEAWNVHTRYATAPDRNEDFPAVIGLPDDDDRERPGSKRETGKRPPAGPGLQLQVFPRRPVPLTVVFAAEPSAIPVYLLTARLRL